MSEQNEVATPSEELVSIEAEIAAKEAEATEEKEEDVTEPEETEETSEEGDSSHVIEDLQRKVEQLEDFIRQSREEQQSEKEPDFDIPEDVKDYLTKFAEDPKGMTEKVIQKAIAPYQKVINEMQQQQAIDYIRTQPDFTEKMYNELLYIVEGADRNRYFNIGNTSYRLKDLPPRQKAEAALQIFRERKQQGKTPASKPKPVTTTKAKKSAKAPAKGEHEMTAEEFAKVHGLFK